MHVFACSRIGVRVDFVVPCGYNSESALHNHVKRPAALLRGKCDFIPNMIEENEHGDVVAAVGKMQHGIEPVSLRGIEEDTDDFPGADTVIDGGIFREHLEVKSFRFGRDVSEHVVGKNFQDLCPALRIPLLRCRNLRSVVEHERIRQGIGCAVDVFVRGILEGRISGSGKILVRNIQVSGGSAPGFEFWLRVRLVWIVGVIWVVRIVGTFRVNLLFRILFFMVVSVCGGATRNHKRTQCDNNPIMLFHDYSHITSGSVPASNPSPVPSGSGVPGS